MIEDLPLLTADPRRAERLRARCHDQLARQRAAQEPQLRWGLEGAIVSGVCLLYAYSVMVIASQVLGGR